MDADGATHVFSSSFSNNSLDPREQELWNLTMRVERIETALEHKIAQERPDAVRRMIDLTASEIDDGP